eukprot:3218124-Pyramimonas_sp.AAC.1
MLCAGGGHGGAAHGAGAVHGGSGHCEQLGGGPRRAVGHRGHALLRHHPAHRRQHDAAGAGGSNRLICCGSTRTLL